MNEHLLNAFPDIRILFTGYAPVHFLCFRPLYERLVRTPGVKVFVSGGLRTKTEQETLYDERGMYDALGVPPDRVLSVEQIRNREFDVLFAANTTLIAPGQARTRVQLFHGISFRNKSIRSENMGCDFYFIAGPYMHRKFIESGLLKSNDPRALNIGFAKTDAMINGTLNRAQWRQRYGFDNGRPVLLYAPTGQKHNSMETMGEEVIGRINAAGRFNLLIKLHDHPKGGRDDWSARIAPLENPHCRLARDLDVVPLMVMSDLLITDASSVSNEYSLLDRPMVFLDVPRLLERAADAEESKLDLETWGRKGGEIVGTPDDVVSVVDHSLRNPSERAATRREMAKDLFYNPGRATDAAMSWLQHHLQSRQPSLPRENRVAI